MYALCSTNVPSAAIVFGECLVSRSRSHTTSLSDSPKAVPDLFPAASTMDKELPTSGQRKLLEWCEGNFEKLNRFCYEVVENCAQAEGGLWANAVCLQVADDGTLQLRCLTCEKTLGVCNSGKAGSHVSVRQRLKPAHLSAHSVAMCLACTRLHTDGVASHAD